MAERILTVGLVQHACVNERQQNLDRSIDGIRKAATQGAQLVMLQELHTSLYFCQVEDEANFRLAEPVPGPTTALLSDIAQENSIVIIGSVFERADDGNHYNTAVVLDADGSLAGTYRKMHIPHDPCYFEKFYFHPGNRGFLPVDTSLGRIGVLVCWDQWFPEAARLMALAGAQLLVYPTAIGFDPRDDSAEQQRQLDAWITVQRGHAIANCLPVVFCNRTGLESDPSGESEGIRFWGNSSIIGPQGEVLVKAGTDTAEVLVGELDTARTSELRNTWTFFRDRRADAYDRLAENGEAAVVSQQDSMDNQQMPDPGTESE